MSNPIPVFTPSGGKPIHKKSKTDGVKSQHKALMTRHKKRKARKKRKR